MAKWGCIRCDSWLPSWDLEVSELNPEVQRGLQTVKKRLGRGHIRPRKEPPHCTGGETEAEKGEGTCSWSQKRYLGVQWGIGPYSPRPRHSATLPLA